MHRGHISTATINGLTYGHTYALRVRACNPVGSSSVIAVSVTTTTWVTDSVSAKKRRVEIADATNPAARHGRLVHTRATGRSRNNTIAVPLNLVRGRPLGRHQAAALSGHGLFRFNSATLTAAGRHQLRRFVTSLAGEKAITCEGYTEYGGRRSSEKSLSIGPATAVCHALKAHGTQVHTTTIGYGGTGQLSSAKRPRSKPTRDHLHQRVTLPTGDLGRIRAVFPPTAQLPNDVLCAK